MGSISNVLLNRAIKSRKHILLFVENNIKAHIEEDIEKIEPKEYVITAIKNMFIDSECGFEIFIEIKSNSSMKKFCFYEGENNNFKSNNEIELSAVVNLIYLAARDKYRVEREDKAGKGYVDFIFYPERKIRMH